MKTKPNIVYILTDQMRAHATGYNGDPNVKTPYLDKLASESVDFTNAISNTPICTPYRACLLSGQYPLTHGLFMNDLTMPDNGNSLAQVYQRAGYDTACIGKWHLDGEGRSAYIPKERRQGFDYWKVLECTHDYNKSYYYEGDDSTKKEWDGYDTYAQTEDAISYVENKKDSDSPFFLYLCYGTPHDPYHTAPEDLMALYPKDKITLRDNVREFKKEEALNQHQGYYAHVTAIDKSVEKLDKALCDSGLKDNTIFVFTSDHGDCLESQSDIKFARGSRKQVPYEESIRVPFLLRYPEKYGEKGRIVDAPIGAPDIMPTLLSMSDLKTPDCVEGIDLSQAIEGNEPERKGVLIANYHPFADNRVSHGGRPYRGIRTKQYTFVRDLNGPWMLFDNKKDPYQLINLVNNKEHSSIQSDLDNELGDILKNQNDSFERPEQLRERFGYEVGTGESIPYKN